MILYVLPVLWMTSCLAVMGHMATSGVAIPGRSLMSMNALLYIGFTCCYIDIDRLACCCYCYCYIQLMTGSFYVSVTVVRI